MYKKMAGWCFIIYKSRMSFRMKRASVLIIRRNASAVAVLVGILNLE